MLLNSDIVAHHGWLERLQYGAYLEEETGIAGPKLLYPDGTIQSGGSLRNVTAPEWFDHAYRFKPADHPPAGVSRNTLAMTGAALYINLAARWGLSGGSNVVRTENDLKRVFPKETWNARHLQIIYFGREYCPALRHDFAACPICSFAASKATIAGRSRRAPSTATRVAPSDRPTRSGGSREDGPSARPR